MTERPLLTLVCGAPGAGKTLLSTSLGIELQKLTGQRVLVLYTDPACPPLPLLFPGSDRDRAGTLARVLCKTNPTRSDVLREILTDRRMPDLGFLGFTLRDAPDTYPIYGRSYASGLLDLLLTLCPYVVVDGSAEPERDSLSAAALHKADAVLRVRPCGPEAAVYASVHPELTKAGRLNLDVLSGTVPQSLRADEDRPDAELPYAPSIPERLRRGLGPAGAFRDRAFREETVRLCHVLTALKEESGEETGHD